MSGIESIGKLREWAKDDNAFAPCKRIREFADEIEREIAERYMELPVDADGVPIRVGDRLESDFCEDGTAVAVEYSEGGWYVSVRPGGWDTPTLHDPKAFTHVKLVTAESLLREFGDWYAHVKGGCDEDGIIAEYAAKLEAWKEGAE